MQFQDGGQYRLPLTRADNADESRLPRWLEGEIRDPQGRYVPATLREFVRMNLEALVERGLSRAQLSRARYQLAEASAPEIGGAWPAEIGGVGEANFFEWRGFVAGGF